LGPPHHGDRTRKFAPRLRAVRGRSFERSDAGLAFRKSLTRQNSTKPRAGTKKGRATSEVSHPATSTYSILRFSLSWSQPIFGICNRAAHGRYAPKVNSNAFRDSDQRAHRVVNTSILEVRTLAGRRTGIQPRSGSKVRVVAGIWRTRSAVSHTLPQSVKDHAAHRDCVVAAFLRSKIAPALARCWFSEFRASSMRPPDSFQP
jgi:hypothetical protein